MKKLSVIGVAIAIIGLLAGVYCQFVIVPAYSVFDIERISDAQIPQWRNLGDQIFLMGSIALFLGILAALFDCLPELKSKKWVGLH